MLQRNYTGVIVLVLHLSICWFEAKSAGPGSLEGNVSLLVTVIKLNLWTLEFRFFFFLFLQDASLAADGDVFGLDGQIEHKLRFLRKHVPRETSLILVGHSIGCYIILEMMKRDPELKVSCYISYV